MQLLKPIIVNPYTYEKQPIYISFLILDSSWTWKKLCKKKGEINVKTS